MPVKISKTSGGKFRVSTPNGVKAKHTTKANAEKQRRLLNAVDHGWKPAKGKKAKKEATNIVRPSHFLTMIEEIEMECDTCGCERDGHQHRECDQCGENPCVCPPMHEDASDLEYGAAKCLRCGGDLDEPTTAHKRICGTCAGIREDELPDFIKDKMKGKDKGKDAEGDEDDEEDEPVEESLADRLLSEITMGNAFADINNPHSVGRYGKGPTITKQPKPYADDPDDDLGRQPGHSVTPEQLDNVIMELDISPEQILEQPEVMEKALEMLSMPPTAASKNALRVAVEKILGDRGF